MTTGGECSEPGEELCDGVCTNTQWDSDNCGMCFFVCEDFQSCSDGKCVEILPYGAPMPEPLWI